MRSRVEIVAERIAGGRTALVRMHAEGQLAVRATGPGRVHLVGTAAGPLGGDEVEVLVRVGAGARLAVHGVAATLALPGRLDDWGRLVTRLEVADGATLDYAPSPLVVCREARLRTLTTLLLTGSGAADVGEQVVLGRHAEPGGEWRGRLVAERNNLPLLRTTQTSALVASAQVGPEGRSARAVVTRLIAGGPEDALPAAAPGGGTVRGGAVRCVLAAGGLLVTALAADLPTALAEAELLLPAVPAPDDGKSVMRVVR